MLEWLLCAASLGTPPHPVEASASAEFLEFLAEWDAADAVLLDGSGTAPAASAEAPVDKGITPPAQPEGQP